MEVEVDDEDAAAEAPPARFGDGDGDVVEDAETAAPVGRCVVEATSQMDRHAVLQGELGGQDRAADL